MTADRLRAAAVSVAGLGFLRPAPGSWGSTPPVAGALLLALGGAPRFAIDVLLAAAAVAASAVCVRLAPWASARFGSDDPRQVVADETAGQCVALLLLPWRPGLDAGAWKWNILLGATAFLAFRLLDVLKPPPLRQAERLPGGWGILADDLLAGLGALALGHALAWCLWPRVAG